MKKKLFIIGVSGLTGYKIAKLTSSKFDVYGTFNKRRIELANCTNLKMDISNTSKLEEIFKEIKPDLVINTSALHNVDYCEDNKEEAFNINAKSVKKLSESCEKIGSRFVHISTDYVFDGNSSTPYIEDDKPNPLSIYGSSKLDGEKAIKKTNHAIIRSSIVYGWASFELANVVSSSGKSMNFAMWLLTKLYNNESLKIVTDQYASATIADSLAESALKITTSNKIGIYHVSGLSCESRYDFSIKLAEKFGYDTSLITKTDSSQFKQKAQRPSFSCLDSQKAVKEFGLDLKTTDESLEIMREQIEQEAPHLIKHN